MIESYRMEVIELYLIYVIKSHFIFFTLRDEKVISGHPVKGGKVVVAKIAFVRTLFTGLTTDTLYQLKYLKQEHRIPSKV